MNKFTSYISWLLLVLALLGWGAIGYGSYWLQNEARERSASVMSADQRAEQAAHASRVKALAAETAAEREYLEAIMRADIVAIASEIENVGEAVGVSARVSKAMPASEDEELPGGESLRNVAFIVQAEGSFAGLVQLVRALELFPGFAEVEQFDIERVTSLERAAQPWRANIRVRIITTSDIAV